MQKIKRLIPVILFAISFAGCGPRPVATPTGTTSPAPIVETPGDFQGNPYPEPGTPDRSPQQVEGGYPGPAGAADVENLPESITIPTPEAGLGVVVGTLLSSGDAGEPYFAELLLVKTVESSQEGYPPSITISREEDPVAVQDKSGKFLFDKILPGSYALVIWDPPLGNPIIKEPDSDEFIVFEVAAGEVTDLGEIVIP